MRCVAIIAAEFALLTLAGCAGDPVKDLGGGRHSIIACSDLGVTNPQVKAVRGAQKYCERYGQMAVVQEFDSDSCPKEGTTAVAAEFTCR